MVTIEVKFLTGRFHATPWMRHVNEGVAEWPPSPWRVLRTLVALWVRYGNITDENIFQSILKKLSSTMPTFNLPQANQSFTQHFMPIKEGSKLKRALVFDNFITMEKNAKCYIIWDTIELNAVENRLLSWLVHKWMYFGRTESWVEVRLVNYPVKANVYLAKNQNDPDVELRNILIASSSEEIYKNLLRDTNELREKGFLEPAGTKWASYAIPRTLIRINPEQPKRTYLIDVDVVRYTVINKPKPLVSETLLVADLARRSAMAQYGRINSHAVTKNLSGKDELGIPLKGHNHAYYLPTDEDKDGFIDHLTIYAPNGFTNSELVALNKIDTLKANFGEWEIKIAYLGAWRKEELANVVPIFKKSKRWVSATPFLLGRHPKYYRSGKPKMNDKKEQIDGPIDQIRKEWDLRRELNRIKAELIEISEPNYKSNQIPKHKYRTRRLKESKNRPELLYNFKIAISSPVSGPISLGANCHFGMGLFVPEGEI